MKRATKLWLVTSVVAVLAAPVVADSNDGIRALKLQIEALHARVVTLEAQRTFASFMPFFAERFHVMHRAGEAGDWAVAAHEFAEMKRLSEASITVNAEQGKLMQAMMAPNFDALNKAIEHADYEKFEPALKQTIATCNACHTATGSSFIQVTLDETQGLSMRHAHRFMPRGVPAGHTHGMPAGHDEMMKPTPGGKPGHDDTNMPKHKD